MSNDFSQTISFYKPVNLSNKRLSKSDLFNFAITVLSVLVWKIRCYMAWITAKVGVKHQSINVHIIFGEEIQFWVFHRTFLNISIDTLISGECRWNDQHVFFIHVYKWKGHRHNIFVLYNKFLIMNWYINDNINYFILLQFK